MKQFIIIFLAVGATACCVAQRVDITMASNSRFLIKSWRQEGADAFELMNKVFNSKAFRDSLANLSFDRESLAQGYVVDEGLPNILGTSILAAIYKEPKVTWRLHYKLLGSALGETAIGSNDTYAYRTVIRSNMKNLAPSKGLAANLCHEYLHRIGFQHTYGPTELKENYEIAPGDMVDLKFYNSDATYRIGWIAYFILKQYEAGKMAL